MSIFLFNTELLYIAYRGFSSNDKNKASLK